MIRPGFYFFLFCCFLSTAAGAQERPTAELIDAVASLRSEKGLPTLRIDQAAMEAAAGYAVQMIEDLRFSHIDRDGKKGVDRYRGAGGPGLQVGEVLGKGPEIGDVITAWENSAAHRGVITDKKWTHLGAGTASIPGGGITAVLVFTRLLYENIDITDLDNDTSAAGGIIVSGSYSGLKDGAIRINGDLINLDEKGEFQVAYPKKKAVYFLRLGVMEEGTFTATETRVYEPIRKPDSS